MNKRKSLLILVTALLSIGSYIMYTNNIIYWDAYAYEVELTDNIEPEFTITVTSQELAEYPELAALLEEVNQDEWAMMSFEEGNAIYEYEDLLESKEPEAPYNYVYLQTGEHSYVVNFTMYGGMEDMPIYLWVSGLSALAAAGLLVSEVLVYLKKKD